MDRFEYVSATTVAEALAQLGEGREVKAGGIDLLDRMKEGLSSPKRIVNIRTISELDGVEIDASGLTIGAATTLATVAAHKPLRDSYRAIADAARAAATPQIRNVATAGGNLLQRPRCWYFRERDFDCLRKGGQGCFAQDGANRYHAIFGNDLCAMVHPSDLAVPLTAFDAVLDMTSAKGTRKVPISTFYVRPETDPTRETDLHRDELLTAHPRPGTAARHPLRLLQTEGKGERRLAARRRGRCPAAFQRSRPARLDRPRRGGRHSLEIETRRNRADRTRHRRDRGASRRRSGCRGCETARLERIQNRGPRDHHPQNHPGGGIVSEPVCRLLRTKSEQPLPSGDEWLPWTSGESSTATYWCLATMEAAGPDGDFAHPHICALKRACFERKE